MTDDKYALNPTPLEQAAIAEATGYGLLAENGGKMLTAETVSTPDELDIANAALRVAARLIPSHQNCPAHPNTHPHCDSASEDICAECWYAELLRLGRKECETP